MKKTLLLALSSLCILMLLDSCNSSRLNCPGFTAKKGSHKGGGHAYASRQHHLKKDKDKDKNKTETASKPAPKSNNNNNGGGLLAMGGAKDKSVEFELPKFVSKDIKDEDVVEANDIFKKNSKNKVSLEKRDNKLYLKADSRKDVTKLIMRELKQKPHASVAAGGGGGMALASGIIGIIAFVFAFGPYISFLAIALGIVAVILGLLSIGSGNSTWALVGIILGALAIIISVLLLLLVFLTIIF